MHARLSSCLQYAALHIKACAGVPCDIRTTRASVHKLIAERSWTGREGATAAAEVAVAMVARKVEAAWAASSAMWHRTAPYR